MQEHGCEKLPGAPFAPSTHLVSLLTNSTSLEQVSDFQMLAFQRPAQSCRVELLVAQGEVRAVADQTLHHRLVATDGCPVQTGAPKKPRQLMSAPFSSRN